MDGASLGNLSYWLCECDTLYAEVDVLCSGIKAGVFHGSPHAPQHHPFWTHAGAHSHESTQGSACPNDLPGGALPL